MTVSAPLRSKSDDDRRVMFKRHMCLFVILASVFTGILYVSHFRQLLQNDPESHVEIQRSDDAIGSPDDDDDDSLTTTIHPDSFDLRNNTSLGDGDDPYNGNVRLDIDRDVLVFLHIQKTGGTTFGRHLVRDLNVTRPCECQKRKKRCDCKNANNQNWIFSRYSTGWICGLHADWTELNDCVDDALNRMERKRRKRRYLYVTMLRDPIQRYLSEWKHVQRGSGAWMSAKLKCNGRRATLEEVPFCFQGETWAGVTLEGFNSCRHNLARNRQTRMLADLSLVGCYNRSATSAERRANVLLESAKKNLRDMAYFGLTEYQLDTRFLFEKTFKVNFVKDFVQHSNTHASRVEMSPDMLRTITELNSLDVELYRYAKELFAARVENFSSVAAVRVEKLSSVAAGVDKFSGASNEIWNNNNNRSEHSSADYD